MCERKILRKIGRVNKKAEPFSAVFALVIEEIRNRRKLFVILEQALDDLHVAFTRRWWTQLFTVFVRCLMALALIAALLLLFPRTAHIGALMFLPIIANIAVLTCSVGFVGTWLITILMTLAGLYLVGWEYDRLKPILFYSRVDKPRRFRYQWIVIPAFFAVGGIAMAVLWWMIRLGNFSNYFNVGVGLKIERRRRSRRIWRDIRDSCGGPLPLHARWPFEQENRIVLRFP